MNGVIVGDKATLTNCILCSNAIVGNEQRVKDDTICFEQEIGSLVPDDVSVSSSSSHMGKGED